MSALKREQVFNFINFLMFMEKNGLKFNFQFIMEVGKENQNHPMPVKLTLRSTETEIFQKSKFHEILVEYDVTD